MDRACLLGLLPCELEFRLELKDEIKDIIASSGNDTTLWSDDTKSWFLYILQTNIERWL